MVKRGLRLTSSDVARKFVPQFIGCDRKYPTNNGDKSCWQNKQQHFKNGDETERPSETRLSRAGMIAVSNTVRYVSVALLELDPFSSMNQLTSANVVLKCAK
jgi:hypothetical protein